MLLVLLKVKFNPDKYPFCTAIKTACVLFFAFSFFLIVPTEALIVFGLKNKDEAISKFEYPLATKYKISNSLLVNLFEQIITSIMA